MNHDEFKEWAAQQLQIEIHNARARKNIEKFHKTGKLTDEKGNEINLGQTVNFIPPNAVELILGKWEKKND